MSGDALRSACLWGDEHTALGEAHVQALGADLALGISRGRFPKPRPSLDDNEDAVLAAAASGRVVLAVADGHRGFDAAEAAIDAVHARVPALLWESDDAGDALRRTVDAAADAIAAVIADSEHERARSRTALSVALVADGSLTAIGLGDSAVVRVPAHGRARLVVEPSAFLGAAPAVREPAVVRLRPGDHVLLTTDGLTDTLGGDWLRDVGPDGAAEADAGTGVTRLLERVLAVGAHDNVAVALWTGGV